MLRVRTQASRGGGFNRGRCAYDPFLMIRRGAAKQMQDRRRPGSRTEAESRRGGSGATAPKGMVRLQRVMADAGVASRRECEAMIESGQVEVNGRVVTSLPVFVDPRVDRIVVAGRPLPRPGRGGKGAKSETGAGASRRIYVMLNKPARTLTTTRDEAGRRTVMDLVQHPSGARLYPVGRLGFETTGLLLLTNDGELTSRLTHARYGVPKTYRAEVKGEVDETALHRLEREALRGERRARRTRRAQTPVIRTSEQGPTPSAGRVSMRIVKREGGKTVLEITMAEGGNRQVERVLGEAGWPVKKLACIAVGPVRLSEVAPGEWRELEREEVRALRQAAGLVRKRAGAKDREAKAPAPSDEEDA